MDRDISEKFKKVTEDQAIMAAMESATSAIERALSSPEHKIYIYGCGSTGRLAKQIECETWK